MRDAKESAIYETQNSDLAAFLLYEGVKLIECAKVDTGRSIVVMRFLDDQGKCLDLERVFINSELKKYRELHKWLLGKIHEKLRD